MSIFKKKIDDEPFVPPEGSNWEQAEDGSWNNFFYRSKQVSSEDKQKQNVSSLRDEANEKHISQPSKGVKVFLTFIQIIGVIIVLLIVNHVSKCNDDRHAATHFFCEECGDEFHIEYQLDKVGHNGVICTNCSIDYHKCMSCELYFNDWNEYDAYHMYCEYCGPEYCGVCENDISCCGRTLPKEMLILEDGQYFCTECYNNK